MKKKKLKLEVYNPKEKIEIPREFLSKIFGGDDYDTNGSSSSNSLEYTYVAETKVEIERTKEK